MSKINTYVGSDGKIHFTNSAGADSVLPFKSSSEGYPKSSYSYYSAVSGAGDWTSKTVTVGTGFKIGIIYFVNICATVDGVNPLSGVTFSGASNLWQVIYTLKNHKNYCAFIKPTSTTVNMTIKSPYANTDRYYVWYFYQYNT